MYKQLYQRPSSVWSAALATLCHLEKNKTLKKQYLIHELCAGLQVEPNMFVSDDTFKIGKTLHIYIPIPIQHLQHYSGIYWQ